MHMSVDRYYCYVYQNAENEDMIYGNHHTDVFYNSICICSLLIYHIYYHCPFAIHMLMLSNAKYST